MHELSLVNSLLDIVEDYARRQPFATLHNLRLSCGRLSCIDPQALRFAFDVQSRGTRAEGARIIFNMLPAVVYCFDCGAESRQDHFEALCPACGSAKVTLTGGTEELRLIDMDVE